MEIDHSKIKELAEPIHFSYNRHGDNLHLVELCKQLGEERNALAEYTLGLIRDLQRMLYDVNEEDLQKLVPADLRKWIRLFRSEFGKPI